MGFPHGVRQKKDESYHFCVDYIKLNECIIKDVYPLLRIKYDLNAIKGADWSSSLDLQSRHWQDAVDEGNNAKPSFTTTFGLWEFYVMLLGMWNTLAMFQWLMERVILSIQWHILVLYLGDVVVYATTQKEHFDRLHLVFQQLRSASL